MQLSQLWEYRKEIWKAGRPSTGLYAFLLSLVSFEFFGWRDWPLGVGVGLVFAAITMSIMRFNDLIDGPNDVRKGKTFAVEHRGELAAACLLDGLAILSGLIAIALFDTGLALFCLFVWTAGLAYSFVPHWFVVQNTIVALCSGSPALCGMVHAQVWDYRSVITFLQFTMLIALNEVYKDIEDRRTDVGYKETLPVRLDYRPNRLRYQAQRTLILLSAGIMLVGAVYHWHPDRSMIVIALTLLPLLAMRQTAAAISCQFIARPLTTMRLTITASGLPLFLPF